MAVRPVQGTTDVLQASDNNNVVAYFSGSSVAVTLPGGLPRTFRTTLLQIGAGPVTITAGSGVTANGLSGDLATTGQYGELVITAYGANLFTVAPESAALPLAGGTMTGAAIFDAGNVVPGSIYDALAYSWNSAGDVGPSIQAAITAATAAGGGTVIVPAGTYNIATALVINTAGVKLQGAGRGIPRDNAPTIFYAVTRLVWTGAGGATMLTVTPGGTQSLYQNDITGIVFDGASLADVCVQLTEVSFSNFEVGVSEPRQVGFWMNTWAGSGQDSPGCQFNVIDVNSRSTSGTYSPTGILFDSGSAASTFNVSYNQMRNLTAWYAKGDGIVFGNSDNNLIFEATSSVDPTNKGGSPIVFANTGYIMPNGLQVQGPAYSQRVIKGGLAVVQGYNSGLTFTLGAGNTGTTALHPVTINTSATAGFRGVSLSFASTTGVAVGMTASAGGYYTGIPNNFYCSGVTGTTVSFPQGFVAAVAIALPVTFSLGATNSAVAGTYLLTAVDGTHWTTTTVPSGGHVQTDIAVSGGVLALTDLVIPLTGTPVAGDTITIVVPSPASNITIEHIDQANSFPLPTVEPGANGWYTLSNNPYPVPFGGTGNINILSGPTTTSGVVEIGGSNSGASGFASVQVGGAAVFVASFGGGSVGGHNTLNTGTYAFAAAGDLCSITGYASVVGGSRATDRGRPALILGGNTLSVGQFQSSRMVLSGTTTGASVRLFATSATTATTTSICNMPINSAAHFSIKVHGRNATTSGTDYDWTVEGMISVDGTLATTALALGTPVALTRGTVTGAAVSVTADTTNGGFNITCTNPTGNSSAWDWVAVLDMAEVA
jgi:hypothetical protein